MMRHLGLGAVVLAMLAAVPCRGQERLPELPTLPDPPSKRAAKPKAADEPHSISGDQSQEAARLANESIRAFLAGDVAKAESLLLDQLKLQPKNFVVYYNLACCRALKHD